MIVKIKRILRKIKSCIPAMNGIANVTFSHLGEDIIMLNMFDRFGIKDITYLDIGANEPIGGNNTYAFYLRGYSGVLIEPNKDLCSLLKKVRPRDTVLNFGIGSDIETDADYYMFGKKNTPINTFSKQDALNYEKEGFKIHEVIKLPLKNINNIIRDNFGGSAPTVISLDVEGLDVIILKSLDFEKYQPLFICVETVTFTLKKEFVKRKDIFELMETKGYFVYADTHVNTIFCSRKVYDRLLQ